MGTSDRTLRGCIRQGIRDYLSELDLCMEEDASGELSQIEFARFSLMPPDTLAAFFEYYSARSKVEIIEKESELLAINRIRNGRIIHESVFQQKMDAFYAAATNLAADKRFSVWLDCKERNISLNLRYAMGVSKEVSIALHEKIEMLDNS